MSAREQMRDKLKCDRRDLKDESRDCQARKVVWQRMMARRNELRAQVEDAEDARRALACRMALKALEARMAKVWI